MKRVTGVSSLSGGDSTTDPSAGMPSDTRNPSGSRHPPTRPGLTLAGAPIEHHAEVTSRRKTGRIPVRGRCVIRDRDKCAAHAGGAGADGLERLGPGRAGPAGHDYARRIDFHLMIIS